MSLFVHFLCPHAACGFRVFFFFKAAATTEIYTLSLHDALPIKPAETAVVVTTDEAGREAAASLRRVDRKSTRLNSGHVSMSYAAFCLKKNSKNRMSITASTRTTSRISLKGRSSIK